MEGEARREEGDGIKRWRRGSQRGWVERQGRGEKRDRKKMGEGGDEGERATARRARADVGKEGKNMQIIPRNTHAPKDICIASSLNISLMHTYSQAHTYESVHVIHSFIHRDKC